MGATGDASRDALGLKSPLLLGPNERGLAPASTLELRLCCGCRGCAQLSRKLRPDSCPGAGGQQQWSSGSALWQLHAARFRLSRAIRSRFGWDG